MTESKEEEVAVLAVETKEETETTKPVVEGMVEATSVTPVVQENVSANSKHPLQFRWTLWFNSPQKKATSSGNWTSNVRQVMSFATVEDFWRLYNNLVPASRLQIGSNYHMFKDGIQPEWEDEFNANGGRWIINFPRKGDDLKQFDDAWLWTLLALIGEYFEDSDDLCGVVISPRKAQNRLALWTRDARKPEVVKRIGAIFKSNLSIQGVIGYQVHSDCMRHGSSYRNANLYEL